MRLTKLAGERRAHLGPTDSAVVPALPLKDPDASLARGETGARWHHWGKEANRPLESATADPRVHAPWSMRASELAQAALAKVPPGAGRKEAIRLAVGALLKAPSLKDAAVSLLVADPAQDPPLVADEGAQLLLNPASNSKLATAVFALATLGASHRFESAVLQREGDLFLRGGFDPSLTQASLRELARTLRGQGLVHIEGDVVLDGSALVGSGVPAGFERYGDQDWAYLARVSALSVDRNLLQLTVRPGPRPGSLATVEACGGGFAIRARVETIAAGSKFSVGCDELDDGAGTLLRAADGRAIIEVTGEIAADYAKGKKLIMKSPEPEVSFAEGVRAAFAAEGLSIAGTVRGGETPKGARHVTTHFSEPLGDLLKESIATSNAFDHEMYLLAAASARLSGRCSLEEATGALESFLHEELGLAGASMKNGSGIGNLNLLSAEHLTQLLSLAVTDPRFSALTAGLARPGQEGTLLSRMLGTPAEGALAAKTGTAENGVALSGVIQRRSDPPLVFSSVINSTTTKRSEMRAVLDALGIVLSTVWSAG